MEGGLKVDLPEDRVAELSRHLTEAATTLDRPDQERYKLPLLLRCARRVAAFSPECFACRSLQDEISRLADSISCPRGLSRRELRSYLDTVESIVWHLRRGHQLVDDGHYVKWLVGMAAASGVSVIVPMLILLNSGITMLVLSMTLAALVFRIAFTYTIGRLLDRRAERQGRLI